MLDQGLAKETQAKGHLCKPSRDEDSRKPRALLCKPSRDEDSRKPRALLCKPSRDRDSRKPRAFMQTGQIYTENRISSLYGIARENGRKKEKCEKTDKEQQMDTHDTGRQRLIKLARPSTSHFAPRPTVGQPTLPHAIRPSPHATRPPPLTISHLFRWDLAVKLRTKPRSPPGPGESGSAFSMHQPCD
jgi:hypothetical protein